MNLKSKKHLVALEGETAVRLTEIARTRQGAIRMICTSKVPKNGSVKGSFTFPADTNAATKVRAYKRPKKKVPKADQMATRRSFAVQSFMGARLKPRGNSAHR